MKVPRLAALRQRIAYALQHPVLRYVVRRVLRYWVEGEGAGLRHVTVSQPGRWLSGTMGCICGDSPPAMEGGC